MMNGGRQLATLHTIRPKRRIGLLPVVVIILLLMIATNIFINELYQVRLHNALGYGSVYVKNLTFQLLSRYGGAVVYALLAAVAVRPFRSLLPSLPYQMLTAVAIFFGWTVGYGMWSLEPTAWYLFFHHVPFRVADPLFHLDLSFYTYDLPILQGVAARVITTLILWLLARVLWFGVTLLRQQGITAGLRPENIHAQLRQLLLWVAALFLLFAAVAVLNRYAIALWAGNGQFIFGPDYVTAHITVPIVSWLRILSWLLVSASVVWMALRVQLVFPVKDGFVVLRFRPFRFPAAAVGLWVLVSILSSLANSLVNGLYVHPNQNTVELPYIQHTIDATRYAMGIQQVQTHRFVPASSITLAAARRDQNALDNVRVNDQNQTTEIYNQLQSFKSYFQFDPASVDRYQQAEVYISAREMNSDQLPVQTWINRTLVYTHGYGVAASPVNAFDKEGLPLLWAKNTPQQTMAPLPNVTRPQIYFGLQGGDVIAPSKQVEFDYPNGSSDVTSHYQGGYGLPVRGNRWLLALQQGTLRFYTTNQLMPTSEFLFDRNIYQRVRDIAPFLTLDHDAFPFIDSRGHIEWMLDAYTSTANVPYAQSYMGTAYIRNSVKVVVDAYSGQVTLYEVDPADPLVQSLAQVYPHLFVTRIPADVRAHFRYPMDLFSAQSQALTRYHMTNASAFYNQEDQWAIASQIYQQNNVEPRPPVYQMIRMPGQTTPQFVLSSLFTPVGKDNLNGWLIADNQPSDYGELHLYQFPQSQLTFGPMQAENQIDADPTISAQLSLWNQQGSKVIRGDLLMVPVANSLLYVEPIYLVADRQNSLPQLERVIIDFDQQVYVNNTMGAALNDLLQAQGQGGLTGPTAPSGPTGGNAPGPATAPSVQQRTALLHRANALFQAYEADTAKGDLQGAGKALQELGQLLGQLTKIQH